MTAAFLAEDDDGPRDRGRVERRNGVELPAEKPGRRCGGHQAERDTGRDGAEAGPENQPQHVRSRRAERHPDADLTRSFGDGVGHDAVQTEGRKQRRDAGEADQQPHDEAPLGHRRCDEILESRDAIQGDRGVLLPKRRPNPINQPRRRGYGRS